MRCNAIVFTDKDQRQYTYCQLEYGHEGEHNTQRRTIVCKSCNETIYGLHPLNDDVSVILMHAAAGHKLEMQNV